MTIEAKKNFDYQEAGLREVTALGLAGFGMIWLANGAFGYHVGREFLKIPEILENPAAVLVAKKMLATGLKEVGFGIMALSGSTAVIVSRVRMSRTK